MHTRTLFGFGFGVVALGLAMGAVACGGDDDGGAGPSAAGASGTAGAAGASSAGSGGSAAGAAGNGGSGTAGSGTAGSGTAGSGAGGAGEAGAGGGGDAGSGGSGTAGAGGGDAGAGGAGGSPSNKSYGYVTLSQTISEFVPGMKFTTVSGVAGFSKPISPSGIPADSPCQVINEGGCQIVICSVPDTSGNGGAAGAGGSAPAPTTVEESAGTIDVGGLLVPVQIKPKADGTGYDPFIGQTAAWDGTQTAKISAAGAAVPAFSAELATPPPVTFTKPVVASPGTQLSVKRTEDFVVTWDASTSAKVQVALTSVKKADGKQDSTAISCSFDGSAMTATVSAATMGKLPDGTGSILVGTGNSTKVEVGDYEVSIDLRNTGVVATAAFE